MDLDDDPAPATSPQRNGMHPGPAPRLAPAAAPITRDYPHSPEAEAFLLSCCLLDAAEVMPKCQAAGITPSSYWSGNNALIFRRMSELWRDTGELDIAALAEELRRTGELLQIGGWPGLTQISGAVPTTVDAAGLIGTVRRDEIRREVIRLSRHAAEVAATSLDPADLLARLEVDLARAVELPAPKIPARPISSFTYPSDSDPNILLGSDDYLGRGGGMLFVSHAGAGKSSWIMDACMSWSLGRPWMGIPCSRPLKSLIIQAEDSDRYIGKIFSSFAHVNSLTEAERETMGRNCAIVRLKGVCGVAFQTELRRLVAAHAPDLVIINPIYLYAEGDIGRSEFAQPFLLGLDAVNREEKFAYILIHHTGKPTPKDAKGKRADVEDWESAYMGFGSSYLANWPRCSALLEPVAGRAGAYMVKLGKGGYNAGVTRKVPQGAGFREEVVTRINIRHSTAKMPVGDRERPVYYWDIDETPPVEEEVKPAKKGTQFTISQFMEFIPGPSAKPLTVAQLFKYAGGVSGIRVGELKDILNSAAADGSIERVLEPTVGVCYRRHL
jgi:hypothetical protein